MIHQPMGGFQGVAADVEIHAREVLEARQKLYELISLHSGKPADQVAKDADRDKFFSPEEAKEYGLIDEIITSDAKSRERKK
jgi:ATP-dependent Clp protease protease subunit